MPTGYTCDIEKGISFKQFVFGCSRAFGAMMHLRDEKFGYEIPTEVAFNTYHSDKLLEIREANLKLASMTKEDCAEAAGKANTKALADYQKHCLEKMRLKEKYLSMKVLAEGWVPPSEEHIALKNFMVSQIADSINFDCSLDYIELPKVFTAEAWLVSESEKNARELKYHEEYNAKEIENNKKVNLWIKQLHESMKDYK